MLHCIERTCDGLGNLFVLFVLHGAQMLVDDGDGILQDLRGAVAVFLPVLVQSELLLVIAQLAKQAFTQIAAAHARGV